MCLIQFLYKSAVQRLNNNILSLIILKFVNESEAVKNMTLIPVFVTFRRALKREKITSRFNLNKLIYQCALRSK